MEAMLNPSIKSPNTILILTEAYHGMAYLTVTKGDLSSPVPKTFLCLILMSYCTQTGEKERGKI